MTNRYFIKSTGFLKASGKDLIDFMNRMSTNDFRKLIKNEFRKTVLTTDKGRIIDLINVVNIDNQPLILTSNNFEEKVKVHLDKYIIMDDVQLEKEQQKYLQIIITGDNLFEVVKRLFDINIEKNIVYILKENDFLYYDDFRFETVNIICKKESLENYKNKLSQLVEMNCAEYEFMRIEAGLPEGENEFNENINPVECGLRQYISFTKGCYIGQEVIARLDSQGKIPKQMVKINSISKIKYGDKIFSEEKEVGFVSSSIKHNEGYTGLGFIRNINLDFAKNYFTENNNEKFKLNIYKIN